MAHIDFKIISTGSKGNAVIIKDIILIDCGVPFKAIKPYSKQLKLVLLTHIHSDHFNKTTIKKLASERPALRFACGRWLVEPLVECGVLKKNIDVVDFDHIYAYKICNIIPVFLKHDVPNCGYHIHFPTGKVFYATDTNNLNGIKAPNYDLYAVEANYEDEIIKQKIKEKELAGIYPYEKRVLKTHLSKSKCDDFIYSNAGPKSEYVYLHCHQDDEVIENDNDGENSQV